MLLNEIAYVGSPSHQSLWISLTKVRTFRITCNDCPLKEAALEECALHLAKALRKRKSECILTGLGKATVIAHRLFPRLTDKLTYKFIAREANSPFK